MTTSFPGPCYGAIMPQNQKSLSISEERLFIYLCKFKYNTEDPITTSCSSCYNTFMNRNIAMVYKKTSLNQQGNDFTFWQAQPYEARITALEEIRREYQVWEQQSQKQIVNVQSGFQRIYRIIKR